MTIIISKNEKIELQVTRGGVFLRPVEDAIKQAKGMLRNSVFFLLSNI